MAKKKKRGQKQRAPQHPPLENLIRTGEAGLYGRVCWSIANRGTEPPRTGKVMTLEGQASRAFRLTLKSVENIERCMGMRTCGEAIDLFAEPAIQREFVWRPEQVCSLCDSVMQGYPFGEFMFWRVEAQNAGQYRWYDFVREYHQRDHPHCPELGPIHDKPLTAVLDGQQRLTAFNIGLRGSMAIKLPYKWWNSQDAFPKRVLALDLLAPPDPDEEGSRYVFEFVNEDRIGLGRVHTT